MRLSSFINPTAIALLLLASTPLSAELLKNPPEVPAHLEFIRTIDLEGYVQQVETDGRGAQTFRLRTRYLDPDVNAFVGLVTGISHFNRDLHLGNGIPPDTGPILWNWGADVGIKRGKHLWEIDLMGAVSATRLGWAVALVGEHDLFPHVGLYHRTEANVFKGDYIADLDQGLWFRWSDIGITIGYRVFDSLHMGRHGPRVGMTLRFESPKIPFIFPSLG